MVNLSALLFTLAALFGSLQAPAAPAAQPATTAAAATSARIWEGRTAEIEEFIRTAPIVRFEDVPIGVTKPQRAYLQPGGPVASVAWKVLPPGRPHGYWESYKSEIAAYELDKLLEMNMVPPTVEKVWKGERGAAILWLKPVRQWKEVEGQPKPDRWNREAVRMKMFDNLICNIDRNAGNLLVDGEWNLFLIDHSRAFIPDKKLPAVMVRIDKELWERMRALDEPTLSATLGKWLDRGQVRAILARRDKMQVLIDKMIKTSSESAIYVK
jgi:hypothetical protein